MNLPLADRGGADRAVAMGLAVDRFSSLPNGSPSGPEDLLAILFLCMFDVDPDSPDPKVVAAKVQMVKLGFGHKIPLDDIERTGLHLLVGWRFGQLHFVQLRASLPGGIDTRELLRGLWKRCVALWGLLEKERAALAVQVDEVRSELSALLLPGLSLLPHQLEGVHRARRCGFRFIFADDMGLGKTVEMLACALLRGDSAFPLLICAPLSMVGTWKREVLKWLHVRSPFVGTLCKAAGPKSLLEQASGRPLVMIGSWAQLVLHELQIREIRPGMFIGDESHYICGWESQRTQSAIRCRSSFGSILLGTGTLMPNGRHIEAYPQLKMVAPDLFSRLRSGGYDSDEGVSRGGDRNGFLKRFCGPKRISLGESKTVTEYNGRSNEVEFGSLLSRVMIRRTKPEVFGAGELPPKTRYVISVDISTAQRMKLAKLRDSVKSTILERALELESALFEEGLSDAHVARRVKSVLSSEAVVLLSKMRVELGKIKAEWAKGRVKELLCEGHKVVVFAWHDEVLHLAHAHFTKLGCSVLLGTGQMAGNQRDRLVAEAESGSHDVVLLSSAYREGITLIHYDRLIMLERWWTPGHEMQAEDRIHRIGQLREVAAEYPVVPDSYDDAVGELQTWKEHGQQQSQGSAQERTYAWLMA